MNSLKKAKLLISPDPLISSRRASLPLLTFEKTSLYDTFASDKRKFSFSPFTVSQVENREIGVPSINVFSPISPLTSPPTPSCKLCASDAIQRGNEARKKPNYLQFEKGVGKSCIHARRASYGAEGIFRTSSPDLWTRESSPWFKRHSPQQRIFSPLFSNKNSPGDSEEPSLSKRRKSFEDSPGSRNQSRLHFPSLSPCFEDKPKQNSFPFEKLTSEIQDTQNGNKNLNSRRSSFHSPNYDYLKVDNSESLNRNVLNNRRNSVESFFTYGGPVNINDLEKGNTSLVNSKPQLVNTLIGRGGFGVVKVGIWRGEKVSIKILRGKKAENSINHEANSLKLGSHLNLVFTYALISYFDSINAKVKTYSLYEETTKESLIPVKSLQSICGLSDEFNYGSSTSLFWSLVVTELCTPSNLLTMINSNQILDIDKMRILYQIASGLNFMHKAGFVHLDVKPSNCLLSSSGIFKLGDFGCTSKMEETLLQPLGTVVYQAPEVLIGKPVNDRCDIYSLGITAWQMLTRETPFAGEHPHVIIYKVTRMNCRPTSKKPLQSFIQDALYSLIKMCWAESPSERPSAASFIRIVTSLYLSFSRLNSENRKPR